MKISERHARLHVPFKTRVNAVSIQSNGVVTVSVPSRPLNGEWTWDEKRGLRKAIEQALDIE